MESDDSADIPLNIMRSRLANSADRSHAHDDSTSPQPSSFSRLKKKRQPKPPQVEYPPSDSDDDIPLSSHLIKPSKPPSKSPAVRRKSAEPKKKDVKMKAKTPAKRAPRAKKEEDAPTRKFEKLGQRRETPPENDPTRLFYQSMYREKVALGKKSLTAESWMLRNGLLDDSEAKKVMARWDLKK